MGIKNFIEDFREFWFAKNEYTIGSKNKKNGRWRFIVFWFKKWFCYFKGHKMFNYTEQVYSCKRCFTTNLHLNPKKGPPLFPRIEGDCKECTYPIFTGVKHICRTPFDKLFDKK